MPTPSSSLGALRPDIRGVLQPYDVAMAEAMMIADRLFPALDVRDVTGTFAEVDVAAVNQIIETIRGKDGRYNQVTWEWGTNGWHTKEYGLEERVDDRDAHRFDSWFDAEVQAAVRSRRLLALSREVRVASAVFDAAAWTPTTITNQWDKPADATPVANVHAAVQRMLDNGLAANALVINQKVYNNLRVCDEVRERIAATGAGERNAKEFVGLAQLRAVFDLEHILVGGAFKNTADEGQTGALSQVWSDEYAAVCRIATTDDIQEPCVGRTFHYTPDGSQIGGLIETYESAERRSQVARARMDVDEQLLIPGAVELLDNVTT